MKKERVYCPECRQLHEEDITCDCQKTEILLDNFWANVRRLRRLREISQVAFSKKIGLGGAYYCQLETRNSKSNLSFTVAIEISKALGVSINTLLTKDAFQV